MSVSFEDFLKSAEVLLNNKDSEEIDFRNLISRSYYAVFHLAKEKQSVLLFLSIMMKIKEAMRKFSFNFPSIQINQLSNLAK
jgi:uncharacterized protein (UPF0332 family)